MNNIYKKIVTVILAVIMLGTVFMGCNDVPEGEDILPVALPDYSSAAHSYDFFGYAAPTDGTYSVDRIPYSSGEDFRTVERFKEYKDAGMTILMLRYENAYSGEPWATSNAKLCFDNGYEAGLEKIILTDNRLLALIQSSRPVSPSGAFNTQEEFEAFVKSCLDVYKDMPGFYGVVLVDEPAYQQLPAYGDVYKAIKKYLPDCFIHCNLYPLSNDLKPKYAPDGDHTLVEAYKMYLRSFLDASEAKELCFDSYPFKTRGNGITTHHYTNFKVAAEICKEYGIQLNTVAQTCSSFKNRVEFYRPCGKSEMYSQLNSYMGFGVRDIAYFTYFTKQENFTDSHIFTDGGSFINRDGTKTDLYYNVQTIHKEMQKFANVSLSYQYNAAAMYTFKPSNFNTQTHLLDFVNDELSLVKDIVIDNDILLATELKDTDNDLLMYMVQNIIDPGWAREGRTSMNVTVEFNSEYTYVAVFEKGNLTYHKLDEGKYTTSLSAGYAEYLIPLK